MAAVLDVLDEATCFRLLPTVALGRVVATSGALPLVVPVPFAVDGHAVLFRTTACSPLARATVDAVVAFQADALEPGLRRGWSVVVTGIATPLTALSDVLRAEQLGLPPEDAGGPGHWVRVVPGLVTGRWLSGPG